jgi:TrpR-related protein YerC/YecD
MRSWQNKQTDDLLAAVLSLRTKDEARKFFRDLLTEAELVEFGKRWQTARLLNEQMPYSEIEQTTGLSSTTVARVSQWLNRGEGGYRLVLNRLFSNHHHASLRRG